MGGTSSADDSTIIDSAFDPTTRRLLVDSGGSGGSISVTDGVTTVTSVTSIDFTSGATVTNGGGGVADVVVTGTGGGFAVQVPTGTVNGVNITFVFTTAPQVIVLDNGNVMNKVSSDGTVNWTGTTTVVLNQPPGFNIFGY